MKRKFKIIRKGFFLLASILMIIMVFWFLILGKIKAQQILSPLLGRVPKSPSELKEVGSEVLGTAEEAATSENAQKVLAEGVKFFENSTLTEPLRILRENLSRKVTETIETIKDLPEREVRTIKREVCKQWLGDEIEESTSSGSP